MQLIGDAARASTSTQSVLDAACAASVGQTTVAGRVARLQDAVGIVIVDGKLLALTAQTPSSLAERRARATARGDVVQFA